MNKRNQEIEKLQETLEKLELKQKEPDDELKMAKIAIERLLETDQTEKEEVIPG